MEFLLQSPIVVDVVKQPPITPEITYPQVILGAIGVAGVIMALAALAGLCAGAVIIYVKRRVEDSTPTTDSSHVKLRI
jgi:hypothetical protein